jgi:hypothetical protein
MTSSCLWSRRLLLGVFAVGAGSALAAAAAVPAFPNPCSHVTVAEMQQLVGTLKGAPKVSDGNNCSFEPAKGPSFVDVELHDGELSAWKRRNGGKSPVAVPEFGVDAFVNLDFEGWVDLYAKKGKLVLRVTMPKGPQSLDTVKAIARTALARM